MRFCLYFFFVSIEFRSIYYNFSVSFNTNSKSIVVVVDGENAFNVNEPLYEMSVD